MLKKTRVWLRRLYAAYCFGYFAYVLIAGIEAWSGTTWSGWWTELLVQSSWYGALWPYYLPSLLGWK